MDASDNLKRYDRQIILPEIGIEGQRKLNNASVLVVGAGGLGSPLLLYLAGAGIGQIGIVDHDIVDESNLQRQILYNMTDIGKNKANVAVDKLRLFNPDIQYTAYPVKLTADNAEELIGHYDFVVDGSDNFPTRYLVNDSCFALNKALVFGSIFQFEGQVSVFNYKGGPDYRSLYPEPPLANQLTNCGESGVIGTLPGIIGSLMANEVIKVICDFGEVLSGQLLIFNALNNNTQLFRFKNPPENQFQNKGKDVHEIKNTNISMDDLERWKVNKIKYQLIDVREVYEYEEYNIGGRNISLYDLNEHLNDLSTQQRLVFCCSAGTRSRMAIQLLKDKFDGLLFTLIIPAKSIQPV
jgi:molybdopterin/thiamine biosynthesis adenylyltransferase/rhodanese-related sulfurtransferase